MSLIVSHSSKCALCQEPIGTASFFSTWGVFLPSEDPLSHYCDAPIHWMCYSAWHHRPRFAKAYVDFWVANEKDNPCWGKAYLDDLAFVTVNPNPPIEMASVRLFATGSDLRIPLHQWTQWLQSPDTTPSFLHPLESLALEKALPKLCAALPSKDDVIKAVDWAEKKRHAEEKEAILLKLKLERLKEFLEEAAIHNKKCLTMEVRRKRKGLTCPHCAHKSRDVRFMNLAPDRKSYFICKACGHSFEP